MNRDKLREMTMQLIYQMDISDEFDMSKLNLIDEDAKLVGKKQAEDTLAAVRDHISDIDSLIEANLEKWSFDRIAKTDLAILRTAVAEMLYVDYIPIPVSINEAVELSKKYGEDNSYKFVNSVLAKIEKSITQE